MTEVYAEFLWALGIVCFGGVIGASLIGLGASEVATISSFAFVSVLAFGIWGDLTRRTR